jgi:hypothetical protein
MGVTVRAIRHEKEIKDIQTAEVEVKLSLFAGETILCTESAKTPPKKKKKTVTNNVFS